MSINKVNTTVEEQNFEFLTNQSSILHTVDTNKITVNGVNVIVDKPKRGDIMCLAKINDKNKIVWIDGLSINLKQLPAAYEAIGICLSVKGNKAMVRYREERDMRWLAADYWELQSDISYGLPQTLYFKIDGKQNSQNPLVLSGVQTQSPEKFVDCINQWFKAYAKIYSCTKELLHVSNESRSSQQINLFCRANQFTLQRKSICFTEQINLLCIRICCVFT